MNTKRDGHPHELLLLPRFLDCQIIDKDGIRCGKVDDIVVEGEPGGKLLATAIITGSGLAQKQKTGFLSKVVELIIPKSRMVQIPLSKIKEFDPLIILHCSRDEIYISKFEKKVISILSHIPIGK